MSRKNVVRPVTEIFSNPMSIELMVTAVPRTHSQLKRGFHSYATRATYVTHATQATQGFTQRTQRTQEVTNDVAVICHVIWLASNQKVPFSCDECFGPCASCVACVNLEQNLALRTLHA